ncbi:unnamed protein product [Didymodactylos carnosus]|uniref:NHL repeat-containing protein n=1 Tax=Didymodactylos carnosus TaxID=1234261 RepID=A0A8S2CXJ9_9BILA|nr:unnamed protein product [Didymodactylos carnosus]CAF3542158.1 unnamed protein product [Didymodactylos carnosus]
MDVSFSLARIQSPLLLPVPSPLVLPVASSLALTVPSPQQPPQLAQPAQARQPPQALLQVNFQFRWNSTGTTVAGMTGSAGASATQLSFPYGLTLDSSNALYIADRDNHRVQKWLTGASTGITVAGQSNGTSGLTLNYLSYPSDVEVDSSSAGALNNQLDTPYGIVHDWSSAILYITDQNNHRVMSYSSGASSGTLVAGGNGAGTGSMQLFYPLGLYFDSSSNSLVIANYGANNVIRWVLGATSWTLIAGSISGSSGGTSTLLQNPFDVTLDSTGNVLFFVFSGSIGVDGMAVDGDDDEGIVSVEEDGNNDS